MFLLLGIFEEMTPVSLQGVGRRRRVYLRHFVWKGIFARRRRPACACVVISAADKQASSAYLSSIDAIVATPTRLSLDEPQPPFRPTVLESGRSEMAVISGTAKKTNKTNHKRKTQNKKPKQKRNVTNWGKPPPQPSPPCGCSCCRLWEESYWLVCWRNVACFHSQQNGRLERFGQHRTKPDALANHPPTQTKQNTHTHTHTHTQTQTHTQRHTQRDTHTHTQHREQKHTTIIK